MGNTIWTCQEDAYIMWGVRKDDLSKESVRKGREKRPYISDDDPKVIELAEKLSNRYGTKRSAQAVCNRFMSLTQAIRYGSTLECITNSIIEEAYDDKNYAFMETQFIQAEQAGSEAIWTEGGPHYLMIDVSVFHDEWQANNKNVWSCINKATVCD